MPQDTKNFLDITAIDTANQLWVAIELAVHDHAVYSFHVNGIPLRSTTGVICVDLLSTIEFDCQVQTGAVEIVRIAINGKEVMPIYLNQSNPPTSWVTDTWTLAIPGPFYTWYHKITGQGWIA